MSIVAVHGPNMSGGQGATGGGSGPVTENAQVRVTADMANGYKFTVEAVNKQRAAADYDWVLTGSTTPTVSDNKGPFTVTYTSAGLKTISLTVAAGAGPPAGGTYNITCQATGAGPRSFGPGDGEEGEGEEPPPEIEAQSEEPPADEGFDPGDYTVQEVMDEANASTDDIDYIQAIRDAEAAGKNRSTLLTQLDALIEQLLGA